MTTIGQRNVFPVPGGGGLTGLLAGLHGYSFWVGNPNPPGDALIRLEARLPKFLAERGWELSFRGCRPAGSVSATAGTRRWSST